MFFCAVIGFGKLRAVRGEGAVGVEIKLVEL
jgi:hypothetical protein